MSRYTYTGHWVSLLARRKTTWTSREEAAVKLRATSYYTIFDPGVLEPVFKYDLRDMQTAQHPHAVTQTTPKAQGLDMCAGPNPKFLSYEASTCSADSLVVPDLNHGDHAVHLEMPGKVAEEIYGWLKKGAEKAAGWGMKKREQ